MPTPLILVNAIARMLRGSEWILLNDILTAFKNPCSINKVNLKIIFKIKNNFVVPNNIIYIIIIIRSLR